MSGGSCLLTPVFAAMRCMMGSAGTESMTADIRHGFRKRITRQRAIGPCLIPVSIVWKSVKVGKCLNQLVKVEGLKVLPSPLPDIRPP